MSIRSSASAVALMLILIVGLMPYEGLAQKAGRRQGGRNRNARPERQERRQTVAGGITGSVVESGTDEPIVGATVAVLNAVDSTVVTGGVTDAAGHFEIMPVRPGRYSVRVSFIGFQSVRVKEVRLTRARPEFDLGKIRLSPGAEQLAEVQVTAEREEVTFEIDRTVYTTRDLPLSAGASTTELLENIPSVEVDVDGRVSLRGSQKVQILINGRRSPVRGDALTSFLEQLPAEMVECVEVIPNPSARYNAEGAAGILNLVLDERVEFGLGGGLSASAATRGRASAGANLRYQRGRVTAFGHYGFRHDNRETENLNYRENRHRDPLTFLDQDNTGETTTDAHVLNAQAEYRLARGSTISLRSLASLRDGRGERLNLSNWLDSARAVTSTRYRLADSRSDAFNFSHALEYRRDFVPGRHEFSARAEYSRSKDDGFDRFDEQESYAAGKPSKLDLQTNDIGETDSRLSFEVDYQRPFGRLARLEVGYHGLVRSIVSGFYSETFSPVQQANLPDVHLNHAFSFDETVHAAYGNLGTQVGKLSVQVGLRFEQTATTFDVTGTDDAYDHDYLSLFPSAFVAYRIGDGQSQVKASYSKRTERPRTNQLNPFARYDDPLNLRIGNPYLLPEFVNAFELAYQRFSRGAAFSLTPFYRSTENIIRRYKRVDDAGISTVSYANLARSHSYGAEMVVTRRIGPVRLTASAAAYQLQTDGSNIDTDLGKDAFTWNTKLNASWRINNGLTAQVHWTYKAPVDVEQGHISSVSVLNLALRQKLFGDRGTLSLKLNDPFDTSSYNFQAVTARYYQESVRRRDTRMLQVSFAYTFGQKPKIRRDPEDEDLSEPELEEVEID